MDQAIIEAFSALNVAGPTSADEILLNPDLRSRFLQLTRAAGGPAEEETALRCLLNLRKRSKLPRAHTPLHSTETSA